MSEERPAMPEDQVDARVARMLSRIGEAAAAGAPIAPPLVLASTYLQPGDPSGPYQYGRWSNPTWDSLEAALGALEDAACVVFPSGMAAIAAVFHATLRQGDRILLPADGYYTTRAFAERYLGPFGVTTDLVATRALAETNLDGFRIVFAETPSNPGLDLCDLRLVAARARAAGALLVVDNTTATALGQQPLDLGADITVSADTKAIAGHSDVLFGHVAARDPALTERVRDWRKLSGAIPGPFEAWLVHRSLASFELRFERICENAQALAERLAAHPAVTQIRYPGLATHPDHALARRQMRRFGGLVAVTLRSEAAARSFLSAARMVNDATSFGGYHTSAERRARWGDPVDPGFLRLSVGCEPLEPLWGDIRRALDTV